MECTEEKKNHLTMTVRSFSLEQHRFGDTGSLQGSPKNNLTEHLLCAVHWSRDFTSAHLMLNNTIR